MSATAIRVENLGKLYRIGAKQERYRTLRDTLTDALTFPVRRMRSAFRRSDNSRPESDNTIWALKDLSFEIKRGEVVGVIGRNGAGKSTLLKILSRIAEPTNGFADIHGRVGSLLEVGTGFHTELTGRENIYLNGAILGMRRTEIERKFDDMVGFAEVEKFIDTPVKHYSTGMYLRLAFAVAAHLEPEILLVDEVLAVGDAAFQKKCLGKIGEVAKEGRTILLVSHNMGSISSLCQTGLYLSGGMLENSGPIEHCIASYMRANQTASGFVRTHKSDKRAFIEYARFTGEPNMPTGDYALIEVGVFSRESFRFGLDWRLRSEMGAPIAWGCPHLQYGQTELLKPGLNKFLFKIGPLPLSEGNYRISLDIDVPQIEYIERLEDCLEFEITSCVLGSSGHSIKAIWNRGPVIFPFEWKKLGIN